MLAIRTERYNKGGHDRSNNYEQRVKHQQDNPLTVYFPVGFEILKDDGTLNSKEQLGMFVRIPLEERRDLLVYVSGTPCHIQVIWGGEKVPNYYYHPLPWDGEVVVLF